MKNYFYLIVITALFALSGCEKPAQDAGKEQAAAKPDSAMTEAMPKQQPGRQLTPEEIAQREESHQLRVNEWDEAAKRAQAAAKWDGETEIVIIKSE